MIQIAKCLGVKLLVMTTLLSACISNLHPDENYGIDPAKTGFVPARIALVPCMVWPDRATAIKNFPIINRPREELKAICEDFDKYVADGFDNQPFMKGLSPKLIERLYTSAGLTPAITDAINEEWRAQPTDCPNCQSLPSSYNRSIKNRTSWQIWLSKFSGATKGADAIMIPFILSTNTRIEDDRGILQSVRSGAVAILLIDTNDGSLIWSGGRKSEVIYKALVNATARSKMPEPPLEDLKRRLFTDAIWLDFPGRQIYR